MPTLALVALLLATGAAAPKKAPPKKAAPTKAAPTATDVDKASRLFKEGAALYKSGQFAEAIKAFEQAGAERPSPEVPYNIGRCWERLGEISNAVRAYKQYLHLASDRRQAAVVQETISTLAKRLGKQGSQQLVIVVSDPPDATITIDGVDRGLSPVVAPLPAGSHEVVVAAEGYDDQRKTVNLTLAKAVDLSFTLLSAAVPVRRAVPPPPPPPPPPPADVPLVEAKPTLTPSTAPSAEVVSSGGAPAPRRRTFTWVAAGVAVAGAGLGAGLGLMTNAKLRELKATERSTQDAQALVDQGKSYALGANISYGVAAGAAVTAVVLFFVEGRTQEAR